MMSDEFMELTAIAQESSEPSDIRHSSFSISFPRRLALSLARRAQRDAPRSGLLIVHSSTNSRAGIARHKPVGQAVPDTIGGGGSGTA